VCGTSVTPKGGDAAPVALWVRFRLLFLTMSLFQAPSPDSAMSPAVLLTDDQTRTLRAAVDRIIPADEWGPSASEAGLLPFLNQQLATSLADRLPEYRVGLSALDAEARAAHDGAAFDALTPAAQDALLTSVAAGQTRADWGTLSPPAFFRELVEHTQEGFYASPAGWSLVGFAEDASADETAAAIADGVAATLAQEEAAQ